MFLPSESLHTAAGWGRHRSLLHHPWCATLTPERVPIGWEGPEGRDLGPSSLLTYLAPGFLFNAWQPRSRQSRDEWDGLPCRGHCGLVLLRSPPCAGCGVLRDRLPLLWPCWSSMHWGPSWNPGLGGGSLPADTETITTCTHARGVKVGSP